MQEFMTTLDWLPGYEISSYGRVVNVKLDKDLKPRETPNGVLYVRVSINGLKREYFIHRLVAAAFFVDYTEGCLVRWKSDDRSDNSIGNLTIEG